MKDNPVSKIDAQKLTPNNYFKNNIISLRKYKNLEPADVSVYLKIEEAKIKAFEDGTDSPTQEEFEKLSSFFGVSQADLLSPSLKKVAKPKMKTHKKLLIAGASILALIFIWSIIISIAAPVSRNRQYKELIGMYYLSYAEVSIGSNRITSTYDLDTVIYMTKANLNWYNHKLTVDQNKQLIFDGNEPIKFKFSLTNIIPGWYLFDFSSSLIICPDKEIASVAQGPLDIRDNPVSYIYKISGIDDSIIALRNDTSQKIKFHIIGPDGNIYLLVYSADISKRLIPYTKPAIYTNYNLNRLYVKMEGFQDIVIDPSNMMQNEKDLYDSVIAMYGKNLKLSDDKIEFNGSVLSLFNPATYIKNGNNITFTDSTLSSVYSAAIDDNKLNLKILSTPQMQYIFEYIADFS